MEEQAKLREEQEKDRIESRRFQKASNQTLENITKAFIEEQRLNREEQKINRAMWQEYLLKNQAVPIAALPPTETTPQLMIGNNPSSSNDSIVSIPKPDNAGPPPLPVGLLESTLCPPPPPATDVVAGQSSSSPQRVSSATDGAGENIPPTLTDEEKSDSGHNLPKDPLLASGIDHSNNPPAGYAQ